MITDTFMHRYDEFDSIKIPNKFFVQIFNLLSDYNVGIRKAFERIEDYKYSEWVNEYIRLISVSIDKFCNELGYADLNKPEYPSLEREFSTQEALENYIYDTTVPAIEKISLIEILLRDIEKHLGNEVKFLEEHIPKYQISADEIERKSQEEQVNYYNKGAESLRKALPLLNEKKTALNLLQITVDKRLKNSKVPLVYHNGYFQKSTDDLIEKKISEPFWNLISDPIYKNVEEDMLEALHRYDTSGVDPAFYAAKSLESMIKIVCANKGLCSGREKGAADYINHLNSKKNGSILNNHEKEELLSMFRIRNSHGGHGAGAEDKMVLTSQQARRFIDSCMVWIFSLSRR